MSLTSFYLFVGFIGGFLFAAHTPIIVSTIAARILAFIAIIGLVLFGKQLDSALLELDIQNWSSLRNRGKWYFVATRYVLIRGFVLSMVFVLPSFAEVTFSNTILLATSAGYLVLAIVLTYFGLVQRRASEQEYAIRLLRKAGEQVRLAQN